MKFYQFKQTQKGIALLAAVMIIVIFVVIGMTAAQKAKESESIAGANVRYGTVFEAAEQSLRDAADYLSRIDGTPYIGTANKTGKDRAKNFDISNLRTKKKGENDYKGMSQTMVTRNPDYAIVWDRKKLQEAVCGKDKNKKNKCPSGINFAVKLESPKWKSDAILSSFEGDGLADNHYMKDDIETYTFIELLKGGSSSEAMVSGDSAIKGSSAGGAGETEYYLITVKASGFPPKEADKKAENARENIIIQAVFARI